MLFTRRLAGAAFATLVLPLTVALPTTGASAAGETCRGQTATIVGTPDGRVKGTSGDDVIVTNGARNVEAKGGDDLVCMMNSRLSTSEYPARVDTAGGADVVDRTGDDLVPATVLLGFDAHDVFYGGTGPDQVVLADGEVHGGGGADDVAIEPDFDLPGRDLVSNAQVDLPGAGSEFALDGEPGPDFSLTGGAVDVTFYRLLGPDTWTFDVPAGTISYGSEARGTFGGLASVLLYTGYFYVAPDDEEPEAASFHYIGDDGPDDVTVRGDSPLLAEVGGGDDRVRSEEGGTLEADLGPGDDRATAECARGPQPKIDGGTGTDTITSQCHGRVDLRADTITGSNGSTRSIPGFENAAITTFQNGDVTGSTLLGDAGPNRLGTNACGVTVGGRGGNDVILADNTDDDDDFYCRNSKLKLKGDRGDDVIRGYSDARVDMYGGPGKDLAMGQRRTGPDTRRGLVRCRAERREACRAF